MNNEKGVIVILMKISDIIKNFISLAIIIIILSCIFSNLLSPFIVNNPNSNMRASIGNPKAIYFYDIDGSCNTNNDDNIESALNYLSTMTGLKFIRIPPPFALIFGGIGYSCGGVHSGNAIGESESSSFGSSWFILVWNNIRLSDTSEQVVLHETLHNIGFGHNENSKSIMYPIKHGNSQIDIEIINFIKTYYINNPVAYMTIITVNMICLPILFLLLLMALLGYCSILFNVRRK